jgi:predicted DNA-binding mobile mystery protein A
MINLQENQRIEKSTSVLRRIKPMLSPRGGWIRSIREALGMTSVQLASRLNTHPSRITRIEEDELKQALTLQTLHKVAEALGCDLIYALVPKTSIETTLRTRARAIAEFKIQRIQHTMALENQSLSPDQLQALLSQEVDMLLHGSLKYLWEENNENNTNSGSNAS